MKKTVEMNEYFSDWKSLGKVRVKLDLSNYAIKTHLKNAKDMLHHLLLKRLI